METIRLTQYSHGAGCGCKISPAVLSEILESSLQAIADPRLLVGNDHRDDAAVYSLGDGTAIISTTDFFMPIVDDPFTFGRIAATNAISDVYAMGGNPFLAIAILGWPIDKLPASVAREVLEGGRKACTDAGVMLAGGHSIDSPEPIFGLAVTGRVAEGRLKRNDNAREGCELFLTKPLGVGILTTAQKRGILKPEHNHIAPDIMTTLNKIGEELSGFEGVYAMTDVTGFGLLGHLLEMCEGSDLTAEINYNEVPRIEVIDEYLAQKCTPGGTQRNWKSFGEKIWLKEESYKSLLCDPQTSGGLLLAVDPDLSSEIEALLKENGLISRSFGKLVSSGKDRIRVN